MLSTYASTVNGASPSESKAMYLMYLMSMRCLKSAHGSSHVNLIFSPRPVLTVGSLRRSVPMSASKSYVYNLLPRLNTMFCNAVLHADCHVHPRRRAHVCIFSVGMFV